jgi:serine O-acetyltransferase
MKNIEKDCKKTKEPGSSFSLSSSAHVQEQTVKSNERTANEWPEKNLPKIVEKLMKAYDACGDLSHLGEERKLPSQDSIVGILDDFMIVLFPTFFANTKLTKANIRYFIGNTLHSLHARLVEQVNQSLEYVCRRDKECPIDICKVRAQTVAKELLENIPTIKELLAGDFQAAYDGDPASKSYEEIVLSYPCVYAVATYRISHELYIRGIPLVPRIMSEHAHCRTGVDIHPGARIGRNFFIDHGTGVVIGETCEIGDNVRIYQGVTLGGQRVGRDDVSKLRGKKRHPTIRNNVIIYAGATILGGKTVIGEGAVIGGNVWITSSIPSDTTVAIAPPKLHYRQQDPKKRA